MSPTPKPPLRSPTLSSSTDLPSPTTLASPRSPTHKRQPSIPEPFPTFDSDGTASTISSTLPIPRTTLLSSSIHQTARNPNPSQRSPTTFTNNDTRSKSGRRQPPESSIPLKSESDRTDALWAEMQATLADVELSASRGTHFFGPAHSAALEDLRKAQVELARAWARGEEDEGNPGEIGRRRGETESDGDSGKSPGTSVKSPRTPRSPKGGEGVGGGGAGEDGEGGAGLADGDIEAARRRREANDRYFYRIQSGVLDVVEKLDGVAEAMGKVERESREVWAGSESEELDSSG